MMDLIFIMALNGVMTSMALLKQKAMKASISFEFIYIGYKEQSALMSKNAMALFVLMATLFVLDS